MGKESLLTKILIDEEHERDDEEEATDTSPAPSPMRLIDYARSVNAEKLKESAMVPGVEEQLSKGRTEEKKKHKGGKEKKNKERKKEKEEKKKKDKKEQETDKIVEEIKQKGENFLGEMLIHMKQMQEHINQQGTEDVERQTPGSKPSLLSITSVNMTGPSSDLMHEEESNHDEEESNHGAGHNTIADRFVRNDEGSATDTSEESTCQLLAGQTSDTEVRSMRLRRMNSDTYLPKPRKEAPSNKMSSGRRYARELRCNFDDDPCDHVANDMAFARMEFIGQHLDKMETERNSHLKMHFCLKRIQNFCSNINQTLNQAVFEETYESAKENCQRLVQTVDALVYQQLTGKLGEKIKKCLRDGRPLETDIPVWALSPTNLKIPSSMEFRFINSDVDMDCPQSSPHLTFTADSRTGALVKKIERLMMLYRTLQREANVSPQYFVYYELLKNLRINLALTSETKSEDNKINDAEAENDDF